MKSSSSSHTSSDQGNYSKTIAMMVFLLIDLGFNSSLDYDSYNGKFSSQLLFVLVLVQLVIQIVIFLVLFLAMADTFLFRVGLLGILINKFRYILLFHPIYIALSIGLGALRVRIASQAMERDESVLLNLWVDDGFIAFSHIQKIAALVYYLFNIRTTIELSKPLYYNQQGWRGYMPFHES